MAGTHLADYPQPLHVYLPRRSHLGSHVQIRMRRGDSPQSRLERVRDAIYPVQFGIFPNRPTLPYPDDEILSGCLVQTRWIYCLGEGWIQFLP